MKLPYLTRSAAGRPESTIAQPFDQWAPTVLRFCELFIGDRHLAEEATIRVFTHSLREQAVVQERTPVRLLACAFREGRSLSTRVPNPPHPLEAAILRLNEVERGVFILRTALSIQVPWVAAILGISHEEAVQQWGTALLEVRNSLLPTGYFKERSK